MKKKFIIGLVLIAAIIVSSIAVPKLFKSQESVYAYSYRDGYAIIPQKADAAGVAVDSAFLLETNLENTVLNVEDAKALIEIQPEVPFTLTQENEKILISLSEPMDFNHIYTISYMGITFSFQTESEFMLLGTLPRNETTNVPTTTGIEFYMSHANAAIEDAFSIEPPVKGSFENHGNVVVFVPKGGLEEKTIYTVTLEANIALEGSDKIIDEGYTFSFETGAKDESQYVEPKGYMSFNNVLSDFSTQEAPRILMSQNIFADDVETSIKTVIYQFANSTEITKALETYGQLPIWANYAYMEQALVDTKGLNKAAEFDIPLGDIYQYPQSLNLPQALASGYYLIDCFWEDTHFQTFIQVTDLSYTMIEDEDAVYYWINDLTTNLPARDAIISDTSGNSEKADSQGIAKIEKASDEALDTSITVRYIKTSDKEAVALSVHWSNRYNSINNLYWRYLQTDRGLYQPNDSIEFYGFLKPRYTNEEIDEVTVELTEGNWFYFDYSPFFKQQEALITKKIDVKNGFYKDNLDIPVLSEGSYQLNVKVGDRLVSTQSIQVQAYVKPDYKMTVTKDKEAVFPGETVNFTVETSFFEGTPTSNLEVGYNIGGMDYVEGNGKTDTQGKLHISYQPIYSSGYQGQVYGYFSSYATLPESGQINGNLDFTIFANDIDVKIESALDKEKASLEITVNSITLERLNNGTAKDSSDYLAGPVQDLVLTGVINRNEWVKTETGEYYDFINKEVRKQYNYHLETTVFDTINLTTNLDGKATYTGTLPKETNVYYTAALDTKDTLNRSMHFESYFSDYDWYYPSDYDYYELRTDKEYYSIGDTIEFSIVNGSKELEKNKFLYIVGQNGVKELVVTEEPAMSLRFDASYVPNIEVRGVLFNGKTYQTTSQAMPKLLLDDKKLSMEIKTDKEVYKPGEEVTVTVDAYYTDIEGNKKFAEDAQVLVGLVDEALFALSDQQIDTLAALYESVSGGIMQIISSHSNQSNNIYRGGYGFGYDTKMETATMDSAAEMSKSAELAPAVTGMTNGGLEDSAYTLRTEFKDTALFELLSLDAKGSGSYTFKLPDNITTWRLTASALSVSLMAGTTIESVPVSLPFFISSTLNTAYLVGDKPSIGLTGYGRSLDESTIITYQVEIAELGFKETVAQKAFERGLLSLPTLPEGAYTLVIKAVTDAGLTDALTETIQVVDSFQETLKAVNYPLTPGMTIGTNNKGMTTLTFLDEGKGKYLPELFRLSYSGGKRIDQRLVGQLANRILSQAFDIDVSNDEVSIMDYMTQEGGFAPLPYGNSDVELTALLAPFVGNDVPKEKLVNYLMNAYYTSDNKGAALYGLSALDEPMLLEMNQYLTVDNRTFVDTLFLALAYGQVGDNYMAHRLYEENVLPLLETYDTSARVKGASDEETFRYTALAMMNAAVLQSTDTDKLLDYIRTHNSKERTSLLEELTTLENLLLHSSSDSAQITYTYQGEETSVDLSSYGSASRKFPSTMLSELEIVSVTGKVSVVASYQAPIGVDTKADENLSVEKTFSKYAQPGQVLDFVSGDIVKVTLKPQIGSQAIDDYYRIVDFAPAGILPLENNNFGLLDDRYWYRETDGQKVTFYYSKDATYQEPLYYYARIISPGDFKAEGVLIQGTRNQESIWVGEAVQIHID